MQIQEQVPLGPLTTLRVGGPAQFLARITTEGELIEAIRFARQQNLPIFPLGGGSNLLISDAGYAGLVLQIAFKPSIVASGESYEVSAGTDWNSLVRKVCEQGIYGAECLSGIPGLVGGSPIQNIGAYGQEVSQTIDSVRAFDLKTSDFATLQRDQCGFAYRSSIFNTTQPNRYVILSVNFNFDRSAGPNLSYGDLERRFSGAKNPPKPMEIYHAVRGIRRAKGMLLVEGEPDCRSAGSFFKNPAVSKAKLAELAALSKVDTSVIPHWPPPGGTGQDKVKLSAAWLVEQAGLPKGFNMGAAGISSRHSLAIINRGGATFADIAALRNTIVGKVEEKFHITLHQEPVQLGS